MGGKIGRKEINKRKKKEKNEVNKTKGKKGRRKEGWWGGGGGGEKIEWKTERKKKEKRVGIKYLKRKYCVGTEPSALVYIYRHFSNFCYHWS